MANKVLVLWSPDAPQTSHWSYRRPTQKIALYREVEDGTFSLVSEESLKNDLKDLPVGTRNVRQGYRFCDNWIGPDPPQQDRLQDEGYARFKCSAFGENTVYMTCHLCDECAYFVPKCPKEIRDLSKLDMFGKRIIELNPSTSERIIDDDKVKRVLEKLRDLKNFDCELGVF
jgi:hypothetical protein